jgi:hypothetical protein
MERRSSDATAAPGPEPEARAAGHIGLESSAMISPPPPPLQPPPAADEPVLRAPDTREWKAVERCGPVWRWTVIAVLVILALATALLWFVR